MRCVLKQSLIIVAIAFSYLNEVIANPITLKEVLTSSMEEVVAPRPNLYNRVKSRITGRVTPKMFGAKGDGIADDTSPIQHAINYAATHNIAEVRIHAGVYNINISGHNSVGEILSIDGEPPEVSGLYWILYCVKSSIRRIESTNVLNAFQVGRDLGQILQL